uniref:Uncharacterized protein n=1 Tax=Chromera velia CCMP2878 TaxID=1169474 RepID=A0A0G4H2K0_9ALVE|mmetsp:Transcript_17627/g.35769  ORF Transcript_17627/g.35769 Transcript_17627/m.35769 type:complete len:397 (+) Transcript_17627:250-1440(+)|eukprot:Cvel_5582.t1-p1 / transcript=Cvel_5582.t1 / gene=Cvel_5582 / organism=Chromera_velia_CCMP2878 / gene_product=hypothetical protein / transcript_product=hypothetical protein / location=Cvel_scaffold262:71239-75686(-) / protein_length=396 / sequence_SO=supercontig / SO=protein_coding / is_pseudo=false
MALHRWTSHGLGVLSSRGLSTRVSSLLGRQAGGRWPGAQGGAVAAARAAFSSSVPSENGVARTRSHRPLGMSAEGEALVGQLRQNPEVAQKFALPDVARAFASCVPSSAREAARLGVSVDEGSREVSVGLFLDQGRGGLPVPPLHHTPVQANATSPFEDPTRLAAATAVSEALQVVDRRSLGVDGVGENVFGSLPEGGARAFGPAAGRSAAEMGGALPDMEVTMRLREGAEGVMGDGAQQEALDAFRRALGQTPNAGNLGALGTGGLSVPPPALQQPEAPRFPLGLDFGGEGSPSSGLHGGLSKFSLNQFLSFGYGYVFSLRDIFIFAFRLIFQTGRPMMAVYIGGTLMKTVFSITLSYSFLLFFSLIAGFEVFYFGLQCYIGFVFLSFFSEGALM